MYIHVLRTQRFAFADMHFYVNTLICLQMSGSRCSHSQTGLRFFEETIKLSDLGLAVKLGKRGFVKGVSGTAPYMSPEMLARTLGFVTLEIGWAPKFVF